MVCIKCGKKTENEQVFCPECLETMDAYPVKPDVHVQLPGRRGLSDPQKASRKRRVPTLVEQVAILRVRQRRLLASVVLLAVLLCGVTGILAYSLITPEETQWGTNYTFDNPFD